MKTNKNLLLSVLCASILSCSSGNLFADDFYPYDRNECCDFLSNFNVGVDFLWWKPCVNDLEFAKVGENLDNVVGLRDVDAPPAPVLEEGVGGNVNESSSSTSSLNRLADQYRVNSRSICPDWQPGFRVSIGKDNCYCDWGFGASYTWVRSHDRRSVHREGEVFSTLFDVGGLEPVWDSSFDSAKARWHMTFQEWDAVIRYDLCCNSCHKLTPFFGLAGIHVTQELKTHFRGVADGGEDQSRPSNSLRSKFYSRFWGVGFRSGFDYSYQLCNCFTFFTKAHGTIVAGQASRRHSHDLDVYFCEGRENVDFEFHTRDSDCCRIIPGYHLAAGIAYDECICNLAVRIKFGWEFLQWFNLPAQQIFRAEDFASGFTQSGPSHRMISFQGLFAGVDVRF
jgi:hypothetical protein